ncbi:MAG: GerAB/ArcD/ProY family transporter [Clostridium sp.]
MLKLNSRHYIFFILAVSTIGLRTYSSVFLRIGIRDTWLATFFASLIFTLFFLFIIYTSIKCNTYKLEEVFSAVYPKYLCYFLVFLVLLGFFSSCIESASIYSSSIHTNNFIETPIWYCLLFFFIPITYVSTKSVKTISYIVLICVSIILFTSFIMFVALFHFKDFSVIFPILFNGISKEIILSFLLSLGSLSSVIIILPYLRFIYDSKNLVKYSFFVCLFIIISTIIYFFSIIATFGPLRAGNIFYPEFINYQRLQINGFIECGEFFFLLRTVFIYSLKYLLSLKAIMIILGDKIHYKRRFTIIFSIISFVITFYCSKNQFFLFNVLRYYQLFLLLVFFIIPLITYIIFFIKKRKSIFN